METSSSPVLEREAEEDRRYGVSRLISFSDGVFAFAMTLLIINILPYADFGSSPTPSGERILHTLLSSAFLTPLFSFVLSFYIIGLTWQSHHWLFRYIVKLNTTLFWLELTLLLFIAFLPFPTALLGRYGTTPIITALYGGLLAMLRFLQVLLWWTASSHHRLIRPTLDQKIMHYVGRRVFLPLPIYLLSIGLVFINPLLAIAAWLSTPFTLGLMDRKYGVKNW